MRSLFPRPRLQYNRFSEFRIQILADLQAGPESVLGHIWKHFGHLNGALKRDKLFMTLRAPIARLSPGTSSSVPAPAGNKQARPRGFRSCPSLIHL